VEKSAAAKLPGDHQHCGAELRRQRGSAGEQRTN